MQQRDLEGKKIETQIAEDDQTESDDGYHSNDTMDSRTKFKNRLKNDFMMIIGSNSTYDMSYLVNSFVGYEICKHDCINRASKSSIFFL